ncbi:MAG: MFS transporter, partial [Anaerolineae bacterium]
TQMATSYWQKLRLFSRDVRLFLVASAMLGFAWDGIRIVLFNLYLLRLGYGTESIGLINAVGSFAFSIFAVLLGTFGAGWNGRRSLVVGISLMVVGLASLPLAGALAPSWQLGWLYAANVISFLGLAMWWVYSIPFLMGTTGTGERNHAFSVQIALAPLAGFAGSLVGGALPGFFAAVRGFSVEDPAAYGYALFVGALLLIPAVLALLPTRDPNSEVVPAGVAAPPKARAGSKAPYGLILLIGVVVWMRFAGTASTNTFFNVYLDDGLGVPTTLIGVVWAVGRLASVPAALATPLAVARWGNARTIVWGSLGLALFMLPLALVPQWPVAGAAFVGISSLFAMTTGPVRVFSQDLVTLDWRPAMSAAMNIGVGMSIAAMSLWGGYAIAGLGYRSLFLAAAGLTVAGALIFWFYFRVPRGEMARAAAEESSSQT